MHSVANILIAWLMQDVATKNHPSLNVGRLQPLYEGLSRQSVLDGDGKPEPGRIGAGISRGQNNKILVRLKSFIEALEVLTPPFHELLNPISLGYTDGRLHISWLKIVSNIGIGIFMIVALGKITELPAETLSASIALTNRTPAIASPVPN